jgi:hypothetical protein
MNRFLASFGCSCALLFSAVAFCQVSTSITTSAGSMHGTARFEPPNHGVRAIVGAPYSADRIDERVQTLADGTHITQTFPETKIYRDSMGRTREERPTYGGPLEGHAIESKAAVIVEINDPVAHLRYIFTLTEPVAHRQELPAEKSRGSSPQLQTGHGVAGSIGETEPLPRAAVRAVAPSTAARRAVDDPNRPQFTTEDLGTQIIEGIQAEGHRQTTTWPVGAIGNDRPVTNTNETWRSPDLREDILRKSDDPRSGESTYKLVNISRSEPDPSLFEAPPGYAVKDEAGEFTISWSSPR